MAPPSHTAGSTIPRVVELTPPGRAAVAVVLVAGPEAVRVVGELFIPVSRSQRDVLPIGRIVLGRWRDADGEELIVCRRTDEQIEIHCHGGAAAVGAVIDSLVDRGCRHISWHEWVGESSRDPLRAAAQIALADAPTARTAAVLLDQYHGALTNAIQLMSAAIAARDWARASEIVDNILTFRDVGLHLTTVWRVVVTGPPNVGKSSLVNAIAGFQRAIVSPLPGTTRDVVTVTTAIDGWPVQLADTAGLRDTHDELESAGLALADAALAEADLVVLVSDASEGVEPTDKIVPRLPPVVRMIEAWNKIDLVPVAERERILAGVGDDPARFNPKSEIRNPKLVSAVTGEGIAELVTAIGRSLVPVAPPTGAAVAFTGDQVSVLDAVRAAIERHDAVAAGAALHSLLADER